MFTASQIVAHLVGDYLLQSHWMATEKRKGHLPAAVHALSYALPFLFLTLDPRALAVIAGTHFLIDRYGLARYVVWAKNRPWPGSKPWRECSATGNDPDAPVWLAGWLTIIADNTMHLVCNALALAWVAT